jgi:polar amino acid transport system permease protein
VILPHIARVLFAPLANQYILMTLGSSMAAVFGVEELTGRAFNVNRLLFSPSRAVRSAPWQAWY